MKKKPVKITPQGLASLWLHALKERRVSMIGGYRYVPGHGLSEAAQICVKTVKVWQPRLSTKELFIEAAKLFQGELPV